MAVTSVGALGMPSEAVPRLLQNLLGGLAAAGLRVVGPDEVTRALKGSEALKGCETSVCLRRIGELVRVPLSARAIVEATGTSYRLEVLLTETVTANVAVRLERRCDVCTLKEANDALSRAAEEAGRKLHGSWVPPAGSVTGDEPGPVEAVPPRARGAAEGRGAPVDRAREAMSARVATDAGRGMTRAERRMKLWGIITASASALGLVPGVALLGLHGKVTDGGCGAKKCIYDSATAGGVLTGLGAAMLVAGGAMLLYAYLPRRREPGADLGRATEGPALRFGAAPILGGGFFQLEGRF